MPAAAHRQLEYSESTAISGAAPMRDEWRQAAPLLEHFQENTRAVEKARIEREKQVIRRARRMHRPLQMRWSVILVTVWLFGLLVGVLWLNGLAQSAVRHARALDADIAQTRDEIERTQKKIASFDSKLKIEPIAEKAGWELAGLNDFDDVTKPDPLPSEAAQPAEEESPREESD